MCYYEFVFRLPNNQSDLVQVLGPVIGGFLAASKGWRWTFWLLAILGGFCSVSAFVIMSETHPKVILERKTASLRADTGNHHLRSKLAGKTSLPTSGCRPGTYSTYCAPVSVAYPLCHIPLRGLGIWSDVPAVYHIHQRIRGPVRIQHFRVRAGVPRSGVLPCRQHAHIQHPE